MRKILLTICVAILSLIANAQEKEVLARYGYAPEVFAEENLLWQGSGENNFLAGMICLDPATDNVIARLEGKQIIGVRCYLHHNYKQAKKERSLIMAAVGAIDATPITKTYDFLAGWNTVYFDEPITVGSEPIFVGCQVYEGRSTAYPLGSFSAHVPGSFFVKVNDEGWNEFSDRGSLLIQAIFNDDAQTELENLVYAQVAKAPMVVATSTPFEAGVYFNNQTDKEVSSVEIQVQGQGDETPYSQLVTFDTPLQPREGRIVNMEITSGCEVGTEQWIQILVTQINGEAAKENRIGESKHYVSDDAFVRIPLIEEFTSQSCQACPFMAYYLDLAMEQYEGEFVYVTHHAGFAIDRFTKPVDNQLLYLFGNEPTFNPAVMYDRTVPVGKYTPIIGASVAEVEPYLLAIQEAANRPAKAEVIVNASREGALVGCNVSGKVSSAIIDSDEEVYISTYLVEYNIPVSTDPSSPNYQTGLDTEDAPQDILEVVKHSGIIRHNFNTQHIGDLISFGDDDNSFNFEYEAVETKDDWNLDNCRVVSFVHKINPTDMTDNYVLNAGYFDLNPISVESINTDEYVRIYSTENGKIITSENIANYYVYDLNGTLLNTNISLQQGVYMVKYQTINGNTGVKKLYVK